MEESLNLIPIFTSAMLLWAVSLVGALAMVVNVERLNKVISHLVSFAVGALLGGAFLHLIPQAFSYESHVSETPIYIIVGLLLFFVLERFLHLHHEHHVDGEPARPKPVVTMSVIGGGMHNFVDGMLVAAAYGVSFESGLVTTVAILLHQVPQEMGDFGVLVQGGLSPKRALLYNFASGTGAVIGAVFSIMIGGIAEQYSPMLLALTAGAFIYIAASDLIPELHRAPGRKAALQQLVLIVAGVAVMMLPQLMEH